jgi:hypothetical protein
MSNSAAFTPSPCKGEGWGGGEGVALCSQFTPIPTFPLAGGRS